MTLNEDMLETLLREPDDETLQELIDSHHLDLEAVEALKGCSADFYFDRPAEAVRIAEVAHRLGRLLPDPGPALGRWTLANALLFADRYHEAVTLFDRARADYLALGRPLDAARMGVGHVWALAYAGAFERALELAAQIEPVLARAAESNAADRRRLGGLFNNVGIVYDLMGRHEEALSAYDRKLRIARGLGNKVDVARTHHNRACALTYLNAFDEALAAFERAEAGFLGAGATADLARLAYNRGTLYARWERFAEAEAEFAAAERQLSSLEDTEQARAALAVYQILARLRRGDAAGDVGEIEGLLDRLREAQTTLAAHGPPFEEGLAWLGLGRCHRALDDPEAARDGFERALALARQGGGEPLAWEALHQLGNLAERREATDAAVGLYERALDHVETMRRNFHVRAFRAGFLADKLTVYGDLALVYARLGRLEEAFAVVERAKSRLLVERLVGRLDDDVAALTASDDSRTQEMACRLRDLLARLEKLYRRARIDAGSERGSWSMAPSAETLAAVERLEAEAQALTRRMDRAWPSLSPLRDGPAVPLKAIQTQLTRSSASDHARRRALLQYHVARGRVRAFVVDSAGIQAYEDLAPLAEVERARRRFSAAVERILGLSTRYGLEQVRRYLPPLAADAKAQLTALYDLLMRPLLPRVTPGMPLVVSPDGPLHYVPFHALHDGTRYLVERHAVSYTPSAAVLDLCARRGATGRGMLVLGYGGEHLSQVTEEIKALGGIFPEADVLSDAEATTARLLEIAPRYGVLHLATHARFRVDRAMLSSLSLADRRLTLAEIARLRLGADLVALSGCETGRGRLYGADMISLACGFLGAGARSLLVSMWRVDDPTAARLMKSFYRALREGAERATALRRAQLALLTLGREQPAAYGLYRHPAYWAPFVLIGEWGRLSDLPHRKEDERCAG